MDNATADAGRDLLVNFDSPSQLRKDTAAFLRRETDSLDDFEHLDHDKDQQQDKDKPQDKGGSSTHSLIDTEPLLDHTFKPEPKKTDTDLLLTGFDEPPPIPAHAEPLFATENLFGTASVTGFKTDAENLFGTGSKVEPDLNLHGKTGFKIETDNLLIGTDNKNEFGIGFEPDKNLYEPEKVDNLFGSNETEKNRYEPEPGKNQSQSFMDFERQSEMVDRYSDSEPEDDFKTTKTDTFKDVEPEPELPERDYFESSPVHVPKQPKTDIIFHQTEPEPVLVAPKPEPPKPEPVIATKPEPVSRIIEPKPEPKKIGESVIFKKKLEQKEAIGAEAMFFKMGLGEFCFSLQQTLLLCL